MAEAVCLPTAAAEAYAATAKNLRFFCDNSIKIINSHTLIDNALVYS